MGEGEEKERLEEEENEKEEEAKHRIQKPRKKGGQQRDVRKTRKMKNKR